MALGPDGLITVVGDVDTITDTKANGSLTVSLSDKLVAGGKTYAPIDQVVQLNPNDGTFAIKLPPTGTSGITYKFSLVVYAYVGGQREHYEESFNTVLVAEDADAQGVIQYRDLAPVATPGVPSTFLTRNAADLRYALKVDIPTLPANLVTADNLSQYLEPVDLTGYATKGDVTAAVNTELAGKVDTAGFEEKVQDALASALVGTGVSIAYDDANNRFTFTVAGGGTGGLDAEGAQDAVGNMLQGLGLIGVSYDDTGNVVRITTTATANSTDAQLRDRGTHTGAQAISTVTGLQAALDAKGTVKTVEGAAPDSAGNVALNLAATYVPQASVTALPATAFIPQGSLVPVTPVLSVNGATPDASGNAAVATGNICIVAETAAGYFLDGVKLTTRRRVGEYYTFIGLSDPPFQAVGDSWRQQDLGFSRELILKSSDAFNQGLELATPAAVTLNGTKWAGDSSYFRQGATGTLNPSSWGSTATTYLVLDQTALAARQAVEFQLAGFSSNTTKTSLYVFLNVTSATATIATLNGYSIRAVIPSTGSADAYWHCQKWVNGTATSLVGNTLGTTQEKDAGITSGITAKYDTDGAGRLTVTRNGAVVASWTDTSPHTGVYAGFGGNNAGGSGISASMNAKGDNWKAYA